MDRTPLGDQGRLSSWLRKHELETAQARLLAQIALETSDAVFKRPSRATAAGDSRKLRGIPAIGRGVTGAIPNTVPHQASPATGLRHALRDMLIDRDGLTCYLCRRQLKVDRCVIEHVIPRARGGGDDPSNLAIACVMCNTRKGDSYVSFDITSGRPVYHTNGRTLALNPR